MSRIKNENYYQVAGWMVNDLCLKGNELAAYAIIYGFTQDGMCDFHGSFQYISDWLGSSRRTAINTINALVSKGYVEKYQLKTSKGLQNRYRAVVKNFHHPSEKISPNNNTYNTHTNMYSAPSYHEVFAEKVKLLKSGKNARDINIDKFMAYINKKKITDWKSELEYWCSLPQF